MEVVNEDLDIYYWIHQHIPEDVKKFGTSMVNAFEPKERFFHMEFFRLKDGSLLALEANLRPPGGYTIDMWNYGNNTDLYKEYGNLLKDNKVYSVFKFPFLVFFVGRKHKYSA